MFFFSMKKKISLEAGAASRLEPKSQNTHKKAGMGTLEPIASVL